MVSVLIASMAASIIFLRAGTRRVFPVEIFLSREVAPLSAICIVSSTSSICSSFCCCFVCILLTGRGCLSCGPEKDRFVRLAAVASGNSIIDGTKGFVQALGICCGAETTFTGSGFLFWLVFGTESLAVCLGRLVLTSIGSSTFAHCGVDDGPEKGRFTTSWMVREARAFFNGMGTGFLVDCLVVGTLCDCVCDVFTLCSAASFFGQRRLVVACPCPQFAHFSVSLSWHWVDVCLPAQYLQVWTSDLQVLAW